MDTNYLGDHHLGPDEPSHVKSAFIAQFSQPYYQRTISVQRQNKYISLQFQTRSRSFVSTGARSLNFPQAYEIRVSTVLFEDWNTSTSTSWHVCNMLRSLAFDRFLQTPREYIHLPQVDILAGTWEWIFSVPRYGDTLWKNSCINIWLLKWLEERHFHALSLANIWSTKLETRKWFKFSLHFISSIILRGTPAQSADDETSICIE